MASQTAVGTWLGSMGSMGRGGDGGDGGDGGLYSLCY